MNLLTFRWSLHLTEPTERPSSAPSAAEVTRDTAGSALLVSKARRTDITAGSGKDTHLPGETILSQRNAVAALRFVSLLPFSHANSPGMHWRMKEVYLVRKYTSSLLQLAL